ncbi:DUF1510 family protein [Neobacillus notoginsengisoli]|uniref:DUF1510 family protein n=1 Tax=Neobacillus notoginsengisoli TaxID=1578198 RepID=A0A417YTT9_9BACI|nr:YrrS family protein [Neobacillus notoginsengisoli]RHW40580.1 DUF1510 family protein [Neobacillus notoginsengisoli]
MDNQYQNGTRSRYRAKRKKTNIILNSLIAIVILLILAVGFSIFANNDDAAPPKQAEKAEAGANAKKPDPNSSEGKEQAGSNENESDENEADQNENGSDESTAEEEESAEPVVQEGGSSPNVKSTIENPGWKPAGTSQTGPHEVTVQQGTADWDDMHNALAQAIGTDKNNMTTWWLERDRSTEGGAIGTVTAKGSDQAYRVYIQWVDGQGYKPVKVEELYENDKK